MSVSLRSLSSSSQQTSPAAMNDLLKPEAILPSLKASSKKQALQELAKKAAELTDQHERAIFDVLVERERLGTTGAAVEQIQKRPGDVRALLFQMQI